MKPQQSRFISDWADIIEDIEIEDSKDYGVSVDAAFLTLLDVIKAFEQDWNISLDDYKPDLYVDDGHVDEVTWAIAHAIENTGTWRDIAEMLSTADENRSVFILSDDGHLYAVNHEDFYDLRNKVVARLREYK